VQGKNKPHVECFIIMRLIYWKRSRVSEIIFIYNLFTKSTDKYIADTRLQERSQEKHMVVWL
jgi:hypothetical protein